MNHPFTDQDKSSVKPQDSETALSRLARFVAEDSLDADDPTLAILRDGVVDTLGCIHVGAHTEVAHKSRSAVLAMQSLGSASVIGTSMTASKPQAAFLNAVAGHALDFDDWEIPGNTHPTVVLFPALLATSQPETTGRDLARAYLAGFEVIARLGEALNFDHYDAGWHSTATLGAPAAAAACARLMGLSASETANAMSLAVSTASGYTCQFGSHAKPLQAGFAARAGVEAASLAATGLTAQAHVLDHPRGMAPLMNGSNLERLEAALLKLGDGYALTEHGLVVKPWPSCGYTHRIMTIALRLHEKLNIAQVSKIDLHLPDFHAAVLPFSQPVNRSEALFSLPYVAAMGLLRGQLTLRDLEQETWADADVAALIAKIQVHPLTPRNPEQNYSIEDSDRICVTLKDGTRIEDSCAFPLGAPQSPMKDRDLWQKFRDNCVGAHEDWMDDLRDWTDASCVQSLMTEQGPKQ